MSSYVQRDKDATDWLLESNFHMLPNGDIFLTQALTYLFLNKFGGTVLTFDTILIKSITALGQLITR